VGGCCVFVLIVGEGDEGAFIFSCVGVVLGICVV